MIFLTFAGVTLLAAVLACWFRSVNSGLVGLMLVFLGSAFILAIVGQPFIAAVLVISGAATTLALFLLSAVGISPPHGPHPPDRRRAQVILGLCASVVLGAGLSAVALTLGAVAPDVGAAVESPSTIPMIGRALLGPHALAFELVAVLLLTSIVASVHLAKGSSS